MPDIHLGKNKSDKESKNQLQEVNKEIKIAAIVPYSIYPAKMGGQKGIALFYRFLSKLRPVVFFTISGNSPPAEQDIESLPLLNSGKSRYVNLLCFFRIRNEIRKRNITHLILEHPYFGWMAVLLKWTTDLNIIIHSHNIEAERFKSTGKWWWKILFHYEKFTHRKADFSFFISEEDREYALKFFKILPEKCAVIPYGIDSDSIPVSESREDARKKIIARWNLGPQTRMLFFNGTLDYAPNREALDIILDEINPRLHKTGQDYVIFICGKSLPEKYQNLESYKKLNVIYAGFVEDINLYFLGTDIFLNPLISGGGIKTKLVEALGNNLTSVSTESGAFGISTQYTGGKLKICKDGDWEAFTGKITELMKYNKEQTPGVFFDAFYWGNIGAAALRHMANMK